MKKKIIIVFLMCVSFHLASATLAVSNNVKNSISEYKKGNYTTCYQNLQKEVVEKKSKDIYANYYFSLAAWKINKIDVAKKHMDIVLTLNPVGDMKIYAEQASACLANFDTCSKGGMKLEMPKQIVNKPPVVEKVTEDELDSFIKNKHVSREFEQNHLDILKQQINSGHDIDGYTFRKYQDYTPNTPNKSNNPNKSQIDEREQTIQQARDLQIEQAVSLLQDIGKTNYSKDFFAVNNIDNSNDITEFNQYSQEKIQAILTDYNNINR